MDQLLERNLLAIAHALFMNRLHLLRLTEVVRYGVKPDPETRILNLPDELDRELRQSAIDFVLATFAPDMHPAINAAKSGWLTPA